MENNGLRKSDVSTAKMLRAAAELAAERGWYRTTLADVASRAGYSHGLVTRRFGSKDGLLVALLAQLDTRTAGVLRTVNGDPGHFGLEFLTELIQSACARIREDPTAERALWSLWFEGIKPVPEVLNGTVRERHAEQHHALVRALELGMERGTIRTDIDCNAAARLIASMTAGATYRWLVNPGFDIEGTFESLIEHLHEWLSNRDGRAGGES